MPPVFQRMIGQLIALVTLTLASSAAWSSPVIFEHPADKLSELGYETTREALVELANNQQADFEPRRLAILLLGDSSDAEAIDVVGKLLLDTNRRVRQLTLRVIEGRRYPGSLPYVMQFIDAFPDVEERWSSVAISALSSSNDAEVIAYLGALAQDQSRNSDYRTRALYALGSGAMVKRLSKELVAGYAYGLIDDPDKSVRAVAAYALGSSSQPVSFDLLIDSISDLEVPLWIRYEVGKFIEWCTQKNFGYTTSETELERALAINRMQDWRDERRATRKIGADEPLQNP